MNRFLISMCALIVVGCAPHPSPTIKPMGTAANVTTHKSGLAEAGYSDAQIVAAHPELMSRKGRFLTIYGQSFEDRGDCQVGDCIQHRVTDVWKGEFVGLEVQGYEDRDYFLVTRNEHIPLGARPVSSPSGRRFFTGHHDDDRWTPYQGAAGWEWEPHPRRLRVVDTDLVAFERFVGWRGDDCVEFIGSRGYNVGLEKARSFWLARRVGDWHILEEPAPSCH